MTNIKNKNIVMIVFWLLLYGLVYVISNIFSRVGLSWATPLAMMIYTVFLLVWIVSTGRGHSVGLCIAHGITPRKYLYFFPLMLLPIYNLIVGISHFTLGQAVVVMSAAVVEEIFFRGVLLSFLLRQNQKSAVLLSSVVFAMFHCANFATEMDARYVIMQLLCALSLGICYAAVVVLCKSILPCIIAHLCVNITGLMVTDLFTEERKMFGLVICIMLQIICGAVSLRKIKIDGHK